MEHRRCCWQLFVLAFLFAVFSAAGAFAATYTVSMSPDSTGNYVCDGTNDEIEINLALVTAAADSSTGGSTVYLKGPATYAIDSTLFIGDRTEFTGDSTAVLRIVDNALWASNVPLIKDMGLRTYGVKIHGFEIDGNSANNTDATRVLGGSYYTVYIPQAGVTNLAIYDMYIHDVLGYGIQCSGSSSVPGDSISIHDNRLLAMGGYCFYAGRNTTNVWVYNNTIRTRKNGCVRFENTNKVRVFNNTIGTASDSCYGSGVSLHRSVAANMGDCEVYGNTFRNLTASALLLTNSSTDARLASTAFVNFHHNKIAVCGTIGNAGGITGGAWGILAQNNVVDSCLAGAVTIAAGKDYVTDSVYVRIQNNIFNNCTLNGTSTAVTHHRAGWELMHLRNNCFNGNFANSSDSIVVNEDNLLNVDPLFADAAAHDYHLKSSSGRWDGSAWVLDSEISPCIDAGVDTCAYANEPAPNGDQINIGLYGNTAEASKSYIDPTLRVTMSPDSTGDYVCDGTADDVEINAALALIGTGGGVYKTVYLTGPATYDITATVWVKSNTEFTGDSTAVMRLSGSTTVNIIKSSAISNVKIHGFEIDGNSVGSTSSAYVVYLNGLVSNIEVYDMYVHASKSGFLQTGTAGSSNISIHDCKLVDLNAAPITIGYSSMASPGITGFSVYNNTIQTHSGHGIAMITTNQVKIYNNTIYGYGVTTSGRGIDIRRAQNIAMNAIEIYGNTISDFYGAGIYFYNSSTTAYTADQAAADIRHNTIINCGSSTAVRAGAIRSNGFNLLVRNNVMDSCRYGAYETCVWSGSSCKETQSDSSFVHVMNNIISNADSIGIWARKAVGIGAAYAKENVVLENNCFFNCAANWDADSIFIATDNLPADSVGSVDPLFADAANGDYHLQSKEGRWDGSGWVTDAVSSPCIDAGLDSCVYADEPSPNGDRINIGLYGNTAEASKTYSVPPLGAILYVATDGTGDFNTDGVNDDVEINAALAMADTSAICNTVYLKAGTYVIDTTLWVGGTITLTGDSTTVIALKDSANWAKRVPMINVLSGGRDIFIHGFEINGNDANNYDIDSTLATPALRGRGKFYYNAIQVDSLCTNVNIYDMYIHENLNDGINITRCDSVFVHDNRIIRPGYDAVGTYFCTNMVVTGNTLQLRYCAGVRLAGDNHVKVYGNDIFGTPSASEGQYGVLIWRRGDNFPTTDVEVYKNWIYGAQYTGIQVQYQSGFGVPTATDASAYIHHNEISNCGWNMSTSGGISTYAFNLTVANNVIDSCKAGGVGVLSTGTEIGSGYTVRLLNNIITNAMYGDLNKAVYNLRPTTEKIALENNCFFGNSTNFAEADSVISSGAEVLADPLFADAANHDYHLKSTTGRWDGSAWVVDSVISPCIDAGVDTCVYDNEPEPNGARINIGVYGNTAEASKSLLSPVLYVTMSPDSTGDFVCDGTADDVEINAALAIADTSARYSTVFLKGAATYMIDTTLFIGDATELTGDSTTVVKVADGVAWPANVFVIYPKRFNIRDLAIHGFEIDGNRAGAAYVGTNNTIVVIDSTTNVGIFDMKLHGSGADLIDIRYCDSVSVYDNILSDANNDAILAYRAYNVSVCNNTIAVRTRDGIRIASTNPAQVCSNTIYGTTETEVHGIGIRNSSSAATWPMTAIEISGNTIYNLDQSGIYVYCSGTAYVDTTNSAWIHHNKIYNCTGSTAGYAGVTTNGFNLKFENNVVDSCANGAFSINPGNDGTMKGLVVSLRNNIFSNSVADTAVVVRRTGTETVSLENNCLFNNLVTYNDSLVNVSENITSDPLFADAVNHDYHLKSEIGRWDGASWVTDTVTSPCIDAGYTGSDYSNEPTPNGDRINIGLYGNTTEASKTKGVGVTEAAPLVFSLAQNVPNPFNPSTVITYSIPTSCTVTLSVYNIAGQKVATLVREKQTAGSHTVRWQPTNLGSGIYFCRMEAGSFTRTTKMVFVK